MADPNPLHMLAELLRGAGAQPVISPERSAPSTIYDLQYRLTVTACAFELHSKPDLVNTRRLQPAKLKLLQFMAIRPWLLPVVREWSANQSEPSLLTSQHLRRGFLGDAMHDDVIAFLTARDVLTRVGSHLVSGKHAYVLTNLFAASIEQNLFASERAVLQELIGIKLTNSMLEG
jgi:hypothetical protein